MCQVEDGDIASPREGQSAVLVLQYRPPPQRLPRWIGPALLDIAFLLGVVAVLLTLNLLRQPTETLVIVVTPTHAPTSAPNEPRQNNDDPGASS